MQSAMFLAVQHDCVPMDKSAGNGPKVEEKKVKKGRQVFILALSTSIREAKPLSCLWLFPFRIS